MTDLKSQISKAIEHLKQECGKLQIGRANTALVDEIEVESYGSMMPLKSVANISCPDAKTIKVEPWDKSVLANIEKAIQEANIGINPQNMGEHLFLPVPPMTEERRRDMVKLVHELAEKGRISIRNARHDVLKRIKSQKDNQEISEDEQKRLEKEVQDLVDEANKEIEVISKAKEADILKV